MPHLTIDNRPVEMPAGATILDAAEKLGIEIPTLCFLPGYEPSTSCLVCMVKDCQTGRIVPACATQVVDGMRIESETEEIARVRRTALELLLSDHAGDCLAPCYFACPAHMDIPLMLEQIGDHSLQTAIATIKKDIALPAVLGRICSKPCEKGCRRGAADGPAAICELKRFVADADLASPHPYRPECQPPTGKRIAVIGAGPAGLAAAYELAQAGHVSVLFDKESRPGGRLRSTAFANDLPSDLLDAEIEQILRLGVDFVGDCQIDSIARQSMPDRPAADRAARQEFPTEAASSDPHRQPLEFGYPSQSEGNEGIAHGSEDVLKSMFRLHAERGVMYPEEGTLFDAVLIAWGTQDPEYGMTWGLKTNRRGIAIDQNRYTTDHPGVFAAGNAVRGSGLVIRSVADGKEAAQSMIDFLAGRPIRTHGRPFSSRLGRLSQEEMDHFLSHATPIGLRNRNLAPTTIRTTRRIRRTAAWRAAALPIISASWNGMLKSTAPTPGVSAAGTGRLTK